MAVDVQVRSASSTMPMLTISLDREYVFDDVPFGGSQVFDLAHPGKQIHGQPQIPGMCLKRACLEE